MIQVRLERIRQLDEIVENDDLAKVFLCQILPGTVHHEDNLSVIRKMADRLNIEPRLFCAYVWLQAYIAQMEKDDHYVVVGVVAQQFGIPLTAFDEYISQRQPILLSLRNGGSSDGWPASESGYNYEEDLLEDGGARGLAQDLDNLFEPTPAWRKPLHSKPR